MDVERLKEFVSLDVEQSEIEGRMKAIKARKGDLEPLIIEDMQAIEMRNTSICGRTVYVSRTIFAGPGTGHGKDDVVTALKAAGMDDYVKADYNANSLSAYIREVDKTITDGVGGASPEEIIAALPDALKGALYVGEKFKLCTRKA